jgi:hypothetical protein
MLLVEIGSESGRRHNSPLTTLPSSEGVMAEGPFGDEQNALLLPLPSLSKLLYITTKLLLLLLLQLPPYAMKGLKHLEPKAMKLNRSLQSSLLINVCPFSYKGTSIYRRPWGRSNNPITPFPFLKTTLHAFEGHNSNSLLRTGFQRVFARSSLLYMRRLLSLLSTATFTRPTRLRVAVLL